MNKQDSVFQSGYLPINFVINDELIINALPSEIWPHALEYTSWQNFTHVERVSGDSGEEDEVVLLRKVEKGLEEFPPYYAKTLKLVPEKQIVWKTYPKEGADYDDFTGIIDFRFAQAGNATRFTYSIYYEFRLLPSAVEDPDKYQKEMKSNFKSLIADTMPRLKVLVESLNSKV